MKENFMNQFNIHPLNLKGTFFDIPNKNWCDDD